MPDNTLTTCNSYPITDFSEEQFDAVVELADAMRELIDQFSRVQQTLDGYEARLLQADPETLKLCQKPDSNTLKQWQEFIDRVATELSTLNAPV